MNQKIYKSYKNKRVLVTGADGFMGSHLVERLLEIGAKVSIFVRGTSVTGTDGYHFRNIEHVIKKFDRIIAGNISSRDSIELIKKTKPQIIFHLAAEAYVPKSFKQPLEIFDVNLGGTLNILEVARSLKNIERVIITSSSEVYGSYPSSISEKNLLSPTSPYGASKVAADRAAYAWHITYGLPIAIIRPFNTYGPRHTYDVVPKFINLALAGKPLIIHGTGKQSRDFTYVSDTISGFLLMGVHPRAVGEPVNFCLGNPVSVEKLAQEIIKISGSKSKIIYDKKRLAEVQQLTCDWNRAKKLFNWSPKVSLNRGLELNIQWARKRRNA